MSEEDILNNTGNDINYIYHISDIHIKKSNDRDDEYKQVFNNLKIYLENEYKNNKEILVVITGDIIDSTYSTNNIILIKKFFNKISDICPIVCMLGNHDLENRNDEMKNYLSPLIT